MALAEMDDTYGFLLGAWRLERTLRDHRLHVRGVLSGTVSVAQTCPPEEVWAHYREEGQLTWGAYSGTARRSLRYVRREGGAVVAIMFEDGRPFVTCDLRSGRCDATHWCRDDRYDISWRVWSRDVIVERWRVCGPRHDYEASSVLRRAASVQAPS